jgi:hypothetical protein
MLFGGVVLAKHDLSGFGKIEKSILLKRQNILLFSEKIFSL